MGVQRVWEELGKGKGGDQNIMKEDFFSLTNRCLSESRKNEVIAISCSRLI